MKVYALTNAWITYDKEADGMCWGVFSTEEKAREAMREAAEETKESWIESDVVDEEYADEIKITESENSCTIEYCEGGDFEIFKIEEIELDEVSNG